MKTKLTKGTKVEVRFETGPNMWTNWYSGIIDDARGHRYWVVKKNSRYDGWTLYKNQENVAWQVKISFGLDWQGE